MKKSMKKIYSMFIVVIMAVTLVGCNLSFGKGKDKYEFKNYVEEYYVNQFFIVNGTKLEIEDDSGKKREIYITKEMIKKLPDMTTAGEKEIVVVYDGKEYSYKITVENRKPDELAEKLNEFLIKYENNGTSNMEVTYALELVAKYFGEEVAVDDEQAMMLFSQLFSEDDLAGTAYDSLFDSIVKESFGLAEEDILNSNELKAKLDLLKTLNEIKESLNEFNFKEYAFEKLFGENDEYNIDMIKDYICEAFAVNSIFGKYGVRNVVSKYYYKVKNFEEFDVGEAFRELFEKIEESTDDESVRLSLGDIEMLANGELLHFLSSRMEAYLLSFAKVMTVEDYESNFYGYDYSPTFVTSQAAQNLINKKVEAEKTIAYNMEAFLLNVVKVDSVKEFKDEILFMLKSLEEYETKMIEITEIQKQNSWILVIDQGYGYVSSTLPIMSYGSDGIDPLYDENIEQYAELRDGYKLCYDELNEKTLVEIIEEQGLVEELVEMYLADYEQAEKEKLIDLIYGLIKAEVSGEETYKTLLDVIFVEEDEVYIEDLVDTICFNFSIESNLGEAKLYIVIEDAFTKMLNMEKVDAFEVLRDIFDIVNQYTTNDMVKIYTNAVQTISDGELLHLGSSIMEDYWTNFAKVMTVEDYNSYWWEDAEAVFVSSQETEALLEKITAAYTDLSYVFEESFAGLFEARSIEDFKSELLNYIGTVRNFANEFIEITEIQQARDWVIVIDDGNGFVDPILGGIYYWNDELFNPSYEETIEDYSDVYEAYNQIYVYIDEYTIVEIIEEQSIVEMIVEMYFQGAAEEDKQALVDLAYGLLKGEAGINDAYDTLFDLLIAPEGTENIISAAISDSFDIEDLEGREKVDELISNILERLANREEIDVIEELKDLFELVELYTENEDVRMVFESIEELSVEELIHLSSTVSEKQMRETWKVMTVQEYSKYMWQNPYAPVYVTNQEAVGLLDKAINAEKSFIYSTEELFANLLGVNSEETLKEQVLKFVEARNTYDREMIEVIEMQRENDWMIVVDENGEWISSSLYYDFDYDNYLVVPDYEYEIERYQDELSQGQEIYDYIESHTILEMIKDNEVAEMLVDKYCGNLSDELKAKLADLIYGVLEGQKEKEEIYEILFDVFVIGENETLRELIEYINLYKEEGIEGIFNQVIEVYKENITDSIMGMAVSLGIDSNPQMKQEVEQLVEETLDAYVKGTLDVEILTECIKDIFADYASDEVKARIAIYTIMYNVFNYDENVDYNELFKNLQLPNEVDNIDYNEMMRRIVNEGTYDVFKIKAMEVEYQVDENDNIIGEVVHLTVDINFDILLVSLKGSLKVDLELELTNNG